MHVHIQPEIQTEPSVQAPRTDGESETCRRRCSWRSAPSPLELLVREAHLTEPPCVAIPALPPSSAPSLTVRLPARATCWAGFLDMLAFSMEHRPHIILTVKSLPFNVFQAMVRPAATRHCPAHCVPAVHEHCPLPAATGLVTTAVPRRMHTCGSSPAHPHARVCFIGSTRCTAMVRETVRMTEPAEFVIS